MAARACYFPILVDENHWVSGAILNDSKKILLYNPNGKESGNKEVMMNLWKLVKSEYDRLASCWMIGVFS